MYPIHCPVVSALGPVIHLGAIEQPASEALNLFSNHQGGLSAPLISASWASITSVGMSSLNMADFISSMRRLNDEAEALAVRYREIEGRTQRDPQRDSSTRIQAATPGPHRAPTFPGLSLSAALLDEMRLKEMRLNHPFRAPSSPASPSRSRWHLSVLSRGQGGLFINEDGRAIHIRQVLNQSVVLGYGWYHSLMHYLEFDATYTAGRSVALFANGEVHRTDFTMDWFSGLVRSMIAFYSATGESVDARIRITGKDARHQPVNLQGLGTEAAFLGRSFRLLSLSDPFTIETEKVADGFRDRNLSAVSAAVPLAEIRHEIEGNEFRLRRSYYRLPKSAVIGETDLPDEIRTKLRFSRPSPTRSPSRP
ncbi:MAG TPA: hypothetical protein VLJ37_08180 [bacterium]|nr:hypothetical protein [bacterium]